MQAAVGRELFQAAARLNSTDKSNPPALTGQLAPPPHDSGVNTPEQQTAVGRELFEAAVRLNSTVTSKPPALTGQVAPTPLDSGDICVNCPPSGEHVPMF